MIKVDPIAFMTSCWSCMLLFKFLDLFIILNDKVINKCDTRL